MKSYSMLGGAIATIKKVKFTIITWFLAVLAWILVNLITSSVEIRSLSIWLPKIFACDRLAQPLTQVARLFMPEKILTA